MVESHLGSANEDFLTGSDFGVTGRGADRYVTWSQMFGETEKGRNGGVRSVFRNFLLAVAVVVACPGDDVLAVSASSALPKSGLEMPVDPDQLVGVLWVHRKLTDTDESLRRVKAYWQKSH